MTELRYPIGRFQRPDNVSESDRQIAIEEIGALPRRCALPYQAGVPSSSTRPIAQMAGPFANCFIMFLRAT